MGIPDADLRNVMAELFRVYFCLATIRVSQHFSSSTDSDGELLGGKCCTALLDALHVHQGESSSDGSLLRPHLDAHRLIHPAITSEGSLRQVGEACWVGPRSLTFGPSRLVHYPMPRDLAALAGIDEDARHTSSLSSLHRADEFRDEKPVADGAHRSRLNISQDCSHGVNELERSRRSSSAHSQTLPSWKSYTQEVGKI